MASNCSQHYKNLSALLVEVGKSCPRFQEYGTLFTESKGLQKHLCLYFAAVIDLCKEIVLFFRKSMIAQLPKLVLSFDATFSSIKATLRQLSTAVKDEVALASSRQEKQERGLNAEERKENSKFRVLATRLKDQTLAEVLRTNKHWDRHRRSGFLANLSQYNHMTAWKQARSKGYTNWIFKDNFYKQWKTGSISGTFRLIGNLGSGKTVAMANVIADLASDGEAQLSYFFCRFDDAESLRARTVIGCLLKQLLTDLDFDAPESITSATDIDDLIDPCLSILLKNPVQRYIICLDGLDECEDGEKKQIIAALGRLSNVHSQTIRVSVFCSVRPDCAQVTENLPGSHVTVTMSGADRDSEITEYIHATLKQQLERKELILGDANLVTCIVEKLRRRADGMYLFVYFQLQSICEQTTDRGIIETLDNLPKDLHETFSRILSRVTSDIALAHKVFGIVAVAERPLEMEELREILAVEPGEPTLDTGNLINNVSKTLSQCGGSLLVVDEEDSTVNFVHQSVRQFFTKEIREKSHLSGYRIDVKEADLDLGLRCITYLNMGVFNTQLTKTNDFAPLNHITPEKIIKSTLAKENATTKLALRLLRGGKGAGCNIGGQLERIAASRNRPVELAFAFLPYAKTHVLSHTKELFECDSDLDAMFRKIFSGSLPFLSLPWSDEKVEPWAPGTDKTLGEGAMSWAVDNSHLGLLYRAMRAQAATGPLYKFSVNFRLSVPRETMRSLLRLCFCHQKIEVIRFLFRTTHIEPSILAKFIAPIISQGDTLLAEWIKQGDLFPSSCCLEVINSFELEQYGITLASFAIRLRSTQLQTYEVDSQWDIIALAAAYNNIHVIELIQSSGALGNLTNDNILQMLLHGLREAACRGHFTMFKHLLVTFPIANYREEPTKISPTEYDNFGWTPLHYAAALPDATIFNELVPLYRGEKLWKGIHPNLVFWIAHDDHQSISTYIGTDKEALSSAEIRDKNGEVVTPVIKAQKDKIIEAQKNERPTPFHFRRPVYNAEKDPRRGVNWSPNTKSPKLKLPEEKRSRQRSILARTKNDVLLLDHRTSDSENNISRLDGATPEIRGHDPSETQSLVGSRTPPLSDPPAYGAARLPLPVQDLVHSLHPSSLDVLDSASQSNDTFVETTLADYYDRESLASNTAACSSLWDAVKINDRIAVEDFFAQQVESDKALVEPSTGIKASPNSCTTSVDGNAVSSNQPPHSNHVFIDNGFADCPSSKIDVEAAPSTLLSEDTLWDDVCEKGKGDSVDTPLRHTSGMPYAKPDTGKIIVTFQRWPIQPRFGRPTTRSRSKHDAQSQILRAQNIALEAQAALIQALQPTAERKYWWERLFPIFVMFILWPSVFLLSMMYVTRRFSNGRHDTGHCNWDEVVG